MLFRSVDADRLGIDDGSLLAVDGGGTALTSRLRFVDLSGLADARIARYWSDNDMAGLDSTETPGWLAPGFYQPRRRAKRTGWVAYFGSCDPACSSPTSGDKMHE